MKKKKDNIITRLVDRIMRWWEYCSTGVWSDGRNTVGVRFVKTVNLSVKSFFDRGLQIKSMALTYNTVLSIVPAFALMVAIGRGFGLQDSVQNELYMLFPAQHKAITTFMKFVDSYLSSTTQGLFVGVGIIVLLWTVIMLLSGIDDAFNSIWDVRSERTLFRKFTDYITICLMVPILLICSSGVSIFMSDTVQGMVYFSFLTPVVNLMLELTPLALSWLAFTISYWLIPNTKVNFKFAAISGLMAAIGFYVVQWLFINGQIYVSRYNAIYGSFAFLPLLLVWLQISWLILLSGCVLTYSLQNVFTFNFLGSEETLSYQSRAVVAVIVMAVVARRFEKGETPLTRTQFAAEYNLPVRVLGRILERLKDGGLIYSVSIKEDEQGIGPSRDVHDMTVGDVLRTFTNAGDSEVSPDFRRIYEPVFEMLSGPEQRSYDAFSRIKLTDVPVPLPEQVHAMVTGEPLVSDSATKP